ncbi:flagellar export chaperone FliS [Aeromonas schubertii]
MYNKGVKAYQKSSLEAELAVADPHRVIQLLMQGALERIAKAKGAIERRDFEQKATLISAANAIINGLQDALDPDQKEISGNFYVFYESIKALLTEASVSMDVAPLDQAISLLLPVKAAWDQIPEAEKQKAYQQRHQGETS